MVVAEAPTGDRGRANRLAMQVVEDPSSDILSLLESCQVGVMVEDTKLVTLCARRVRSTHAETWEAQLYSSLAAGMAGDLDEARRALDRAHAAGLDDEAYASLEEMLDDAEPPLMVWAKRVGVGLAIWIALAFALILAAFVLSRSTLARAEREALDPDASAHAHDSGLRKVYATVLWLCCAYYYLSVPLVLLSVVALAGGIIVGFLYIGRIPIKLVLIVVVVAGGSIVAVLKSFFTRPQEVSPGQPLDLAEAPGLREVLTEVAAAVGTRPVDRVYLEAGAEIAVFERGGLLAKLRGQGERCLLLGVAVLDGMDSQAFKSILAHEYGHFSNQDTAGGNFALGVRRSILHSAVGIANAGAAGWYNPAWLFLNGFYKVFLRISQGASRLQEILADRWAARCYGAANFERGLRHVIAADLRFDAHADATLREIIDARKRLQNLYGYALTQPASDEASIERQVEDAINEPPSPYDSHPRPADRFRWAKGIATKADAGVIDERPAWALFGDRAAIEERLTDVIRERVAAQTGFVIPRTQAELDEAELEGDDGDDEWAHEG
jgi:Zn-dependent protease with chaperone function